MMCSNKLQIKQNMPVFCSLYFLILKNIYKSFLKKSLLQMSGQLRFYDKVLVYRCRGGISTEGFSASFQWQLLYCLHFYMHVMPCS